MTPEQLIKIGLAIATIALLGAIGYLLWIALVQIQLPPFPTQPSTEPADVFGAYLIRVGLLIMVVSAAIGLATQLLGLWVTAKEGLTPARIAGDFKNALGAAAELVKVPAGIGFLILSVGGILMFGEALASPEA